MLLVNKRSAGLVMFLGVSLVASIWLLLVSTAFYGSVYWYFRPNYIVETQVDFDETIGKTLVATLQLPMDTLQHEDYAITLELELPRSETNKEAGNFFTVIQFYGDNEDMKYHKSSMLPFKSYIVDVLDQLVFSPLYILGLRSQTELVPVALVDAVENPNAHYQRFNIRISKILDISNARLVWSTKLSGIRRFMYYNPFMSFFICVGGLWFVGMVTTITVCLLVWARTSLSAPAAAHAKAKVTKEAVKEAQEDRPVRPAEPKRSSSASIHFEWNKPVPSVYTSARLSPTHPRSRRSSRASLKRPKAVHSVKAEYDSASASDGSEGWQEETMPTIHSDFDVQKEE